MTKNFDDFLATLTEETFIEIARSINESQIKTQFSLTPEGLNNFSQSMAVVDIQITLKLLSLYHDWLNS